MVKCWLVALIGGVGVTFPGCHGFSQIQLYNDIDQLHITTITHSGSTLGADIGCITLSTDYNVSKLFGSVMADCCMFVLIFSSKR